MAIPRVYITGGTVSCAQGSDSFTGVGTLFGVHDLEGAVLRKFPISGPPVVIGVVEAIDPRFPEGLYENLGPIPLVHTYEGPDVTNESRYILSLSPAMIAQATLSAVLARFLAHLEKGAGLTYNTADTIDYDFVEDNSIIVDADTRTISQWRHGVLEPLDIVGISYTPRGAWDSATTYAINDLVEHDGANFLSNAGTNLNNEPDTDPVPASNTWWTVLHLPRVGDKFAIAAYIAGRPLSSETVIRHVFAMTVAFDADIPEAQIDADIAATAETVFDLQKDGVSFGTITFAAAGTTGVVDCTAQTFTPGQVLEIVAPATRDATLASIALTLVGLRDGGADLDALPLSGGQMTGDLVFRTSQSLASAATTDLGSVAGNIINITGSVTITSFGTATSGLIKFVRFDAAPLLTHNASSLILPGGANIQSAAGDTMLVESLGSGNWKCLTYTKATGKPVIGPAAADITDASAAGRALLAGARGADLFKILSADDTGGLNSTSAQPWFPTAGAVAVAAATTYFFEGVLHLTRSAGTTSHTTSLLFGGTATLTAIDYVARAKTGDTAASAAENSVISQVATAIVVKGASTSATEVIAVEIRGVVRINGAGTFIPQFQYSAAPGGTPTIERGTYFRMFPVGDNTVQTAGTWS